MTARPTTAELVHAGIRRCSTARCAATDRFQRKAITAMQWRTTLAGLHARDARWWGVLARAATLDQAIPTVFLYAVYAAEGAALREAAHWADSARDHARTAAAARVA
ncbi:hypothetical protein [Pseudonocardia alni]|uniref:hypothetical protein n=1 Tax=Pseudonocardia alni TaxID=33907 RepID=UPI0033221AA6